MTCPRTIALLMSPAVEPRNFDHSKWDCIWVEDSRANRLLFASADQDSITWFQRPDAPESLALRELIEMIEDHHGPYVCTMPWQELSVLGLSRRDALVEAVGDDAEFTIRLDGPVPRLERASNV